jgi:Tfp pilus assembly protein PilF
MGRVGSRGLLIGLLGLLPQLGCVSFNDYVHRMVVSKLTGSGELSAETQVQICMTMAQTLENNGQEAEAIVQYEKARSLDPDLKQATRRLAVLYDRQGDQERALAEYQQALKDSPHDATVYNDLGYCYYCRGKWAEAEQNFRAALREDAKHQRAWNNLGMTLAQQQRYVESMQAFSKAVRPAEAHCNLAFILTAQGKRFEAQREYRQALALEPDLQIARTALGKLEADQKHNRLPDDLSFREKVIRETINH